MKFKLFLLCLVFSQTCFSDERFILEKFNNDGDKAIIYELGCCENMIGTNKKKFPHFILRTYVGDTGFVDWFLTASEIRKIKNEIDEVLQYDQKVIKKGIEVEGKTFPRISLSDAKVHKYKNGAFNLKLWNINFNIVYNNPPPTFVWIMANTQDQDSRVVQNIQSVDMNELKKLKNMFSEDNIKKGLELYATR